LKASGDWPAFLARMGNWGFGLFPKPAERRGGLRKTSGVFRGAANRQAQAPARAPAKPRLAPGPWPRAMARIQGGLGENQNAAYFRRRFDDFSFIMRKQKNVYKNRELQIGFFNPEIY
jgi:hypothetical protein